MTAGQAAHPLWIGIAQLRNGEPCSLDAVQYLASHDRQRYATFVSDKRRREFLRGRWLLHNAASAWLGHADGFVIDSAPSGAVQITVAGAVPIAVSLSHAGGWFACAFTRGGTVGIDIEPLVERDFAAMDDMAFGGNLHPPLHQLPVNARGEEFYRRWTSHEARFKAVGDVDIPTATLVMRTYAIHDQLMLSVCHDAGMPLATCPVVMEWVPGKGFQECATRNCKSSP